MVKQIPRNQFRAGELSGSGGGSFVGKRAAMTVRLTPSVREGLELLHSASGVPMSKLMNDGLAQYVKMRTEALESDLRAALTRIHQYRQQDPGFEQVTAQIIGEEVAAHADPVEGRAVAAHEPGPVVARVRSLISESS